MVEKESIIKDKGIRDSYVSLQEEFCKQNKIDLNTLIDSGDWFAKFNEWQEERMKQKIAQ